MESCIFCRIINQEIPSYKVYEDDKVYAFLDISQAMKGHTLVVPKCHIADIFEYDLELAGEAFSRVLKIAQALERTFSEMKGLNTLNNNRELVYQPTLHLYIHLVPRYSKEDDLPIHLGGHQDSYEPEELKATQETVVKQVHSDD